MSYFPFMNNLPPNPGFIHEQLRHAFAEPYVQTRFDDKQLSSFVQTGNDAQTVSSWESKIPAKELSCVYSALDTKQYQDWLNLPRSGKLLVHWTYRDSGPRVGFQHSPLCALCDKIVSTLRFKRDWLVVQWNCGQIYSTEAGSPHAMLVSILGQLLLLGQYEFGDTHELDLLENAARNFCSIEWLTNLIRMHLQMLPESKTVVVVVEGVDLFDTREFQYFRGATLKTMDFLLHEVMVDSTIRAKFKVLIASAPAPSWYAVFKPEETVQLVGPPPVINIASPGIQEVPGKGCLIDLVTGSKHSPFFPVELYRLRI